MSALPATVELETSGFDFADLRSFDRIPDVGHDVAVLLGEVVVYDTDALSREGLQEGALYVVESQRPVAGMSWETHDRLNRSLPLDEPRSRIETSRRVIRALPHPRLAEHWSYVLPSGLHDGPIADYAAAFNMVGKVVGVFRPRLAGGQP